AAQPAAVSGRFSTSLMWWHGPNPSISKARFSDAVPVRPKPAPMTSTIRAPLSQIAVRRTARGSSARAEGSAIGHRGGTQRRSVAPGWEHDEDDAGDPRPAGRRPGGADRGRAAPAGAGPGGGPGARARGRRQPD